ncbi:6-carboxytetrahydropterin synthase QueD [Sporolituus thermophilus]|uniref:6-carboxy-5,6,7,8-tetrahydropterin synthase n=1 Tax=Sporolituus thermophilus DSM 23256 TaxID=1123285 RepID=A0A1G7NX02_9FIRM|nr:6-carboxytetrahydropterin synthase QueD [Sporolituus thermophilus]SDF78552.1 6-pyruvoyltetrahydropterin/6-carboxytetrahydropterin synthase [Sporolituus thermophilus DSM 23256]
MRQPTVRTTKIFTFDAAHFLPGHQGKCANMHGHTYRLEVTVERKAGGVASGGPEDGMVIDFGRLNAIIKEQIIEKLDHKILNECFPFRPTSENMALYIFDYLNTALASDDVKVVRVVLWETPTSYAEVSV